MGEGARQYKFADEFTSNKVFFLERVPIIIGDVNNEIICYLNKNPKFLYEISSRRFEELIAAVLSNNGFKVELTKATKDGGYDIFCVSQNPLGLTSNLIVECKKYSRDHKVGVDIVRSLIGVKEQNHIANALLATTSFFTRGANEIKSSRYDLEFADFNTIVDWLGMGKSR